MASVHLDYDGVRKIRICIFDDDIWDDVKFLFDNLTLSPGFRNLKFETSEERRPFEIDSGSYLLSANSYDGRDEKWKTKKIKTPADLFNKLKKETSRGMFLKLKVMRTHNFDYEKYVNLIVSLSFFISLSTSACN